MKTQDVQIVMENLTIQNNTFQIMCEFILEIKNIARTGYVSPLTQEGRILVNGIVASCYATIENNYLADTTLAPIRLWYSIA